MAFYASANYTAFLIVLMFIPVACVIHVRYKLFSKKKTGINSFVNQWIIKFRLMRFHSIGASIKVIFTLLFLTLFFCNCAFVCITPPHYRVFTQRKHIFAYILMCLCICKKKIMSPIKRCTQMKDTFLTSILLRLSQILFSELSENLRGYRISFL